MFENTAHVYQLPVTLTLTNGEHMHGDLLLSRMQTLIDVMNKGDPFVQMLGEDRRTFAIAKHSIALARVNPPERSALEVASASDPRTVLGVDKREDPHTIREAYLKKVRQYHPDNFAGVSLPPEVARYIEAMFHRIQSAYEELQPKKKTARTGVDSPP
jgi:DnaJ-domain-containing protein 1